MENGALQEIRDWLIEEIYQIEDLLVTGGEDARYWRLYGKREAYNEALTTIENYL